jgi:vacuolar-type H+-ATPase subunit E/Vma4
MNNKRRKTIMEISKKIEAVAQHLRDVLDEEQEAFDNMIEGAQCSDRGIESENAQECIDSAIESLEDALATLEEIC